MRRLFWLALGAAAGVYAVRRLSRKAERFTPDGLANQVARLGGVVRTVGEEVRDAMATREQELRAGLGLQPDDTGTSTAGTSTAGTSAAGRSTAGRSTAGRGPGRRVRGRDS